MDRYIVSKPELETICLMALRDALGEVRSVAISSADGIGECDWEVRQIDPMPGRFRLEVAMHRLRELQATFKLDPSSREIGHGGFGEVRKQLRSPLPSNIWTAE